MDPASTHPDTPPAAGSTPAEQPTGPRRGRRRGELSVATIARLAGVSKPTVSKVLNGRSGVALDTRRRIEALVREQGYQRPGSVAPTAGLEVVFYQLESHLAIEILRGVEEVARANELSVGFTEAQGRTNPGRSWAEQLLGRRPVGVIAVYSAFTPEQHAQLAASAIPLVALDPIGEPAHPTPSVGATNWNGGITATRHLLDLGHRRIAVISGPVEMLGARARLEGCRAAMDSVGVRLDDDLVRSGRFYYEDGQRLGRELLDRPDRPTAVICGNDLQALGVYTAAWQLGLRIPDDLSVVGFDDIDNARWCCPPLTTVRQPLAEMASTAAAMVLKMAAGGSLSQHRVEIGTTLVVRGSTAAPSTQR
ncbi:LacI family DNA-binding transcriptional regulator [Micromonospora sp. NBC_01813]|uniref:LacI family DNA-binding transcriptional regulator n=1 Tax=Micromonospora sp. NBC_01813 TaxID=2975988 RepID=UPI002DDAB710|nr:LacI family DNA-binding transcriptional regulator [Micromonospora sp. NBC_01813]WSA12044.1 LacI family DNA-binding transcriptional regulator [Micromonospora sp. NBC_01813]